eukprot:434524_1
MGSMCKCFMKTTNSQQDTSRNETPEHTHSAIGLAKPSIIQYQPLSKEHPNIIQTNIQPQLPINTDKNNNSELLKFGDSETSEGYEPIIDYWFRISCNKFQIPLDITQLIIHYTQFFEFQSNHPLISTSDNGLIATHTSSLGDATIMFGRPFPFLSTSNSKKNIKVIDKFRTKYKLELKIIDCGCSDNIGIAFVPKSFTHLKGSPYKYKETYIIYSDGVYHDWNQQCKHTRNSFTFNENGTVLRIIIDTLNAKIIIMNKNRNNKKHTINIHPKYCFTNKYGGKQQMRCAFVMYSGGEPENSKIEIMSQAWQNQPLTV